MAQAFALFLVPVRRYDNTRFSWTLTGLLIRIGQSLGLHREGTHFAQLKPFDVEMRRRLWWVLCLLDVRSAEEQGTELIIAEKSHDTRLPLNVNDSDLDPDMTDFPEERQGATDMSFSLIRYEICTFATTMHIAAASITSSQNLDLQTSAQEKEQLLKQVFDRVENKYLRGSSSKDTNLLHWVASLIARLIMAKLGLFIYQPIFMGRGGEDLSQDVRDRLFMSCIEVMEYNKILNGEPKCRQWRWLFQTYTQWHAVAYLLIEIRRRPWAPSLERAWVALNETFRDTEPVEYAKLMKNSAAWVPLRKLMLRAEQHRKAELARLRDDPNAAEQLDIDEANKYVPSSFDRLPSNMRNMIAQERWRTLVGREQFNKPKMPWLQNTNFGSPVGPAAQMGDIQRQEQPLPQPGAGPADLQSVYVDRMMQSHRFQEEDFLAAAFPGGNISGGMYQEFAQRVFFSHPDPIPPPISTTQPQGQPSNELSARGVGTPTYTSTGTPTAPGNSTRDPDADLPPWLWGTAPISDGTIPNRTGSGSLMPTGPVPHDVDMSMDDDINWQNWQESIRGLEMDTGIGIGRTFLGSI